MRKKVEVKMAKTCAWSVQSVSKKVQLCERKGWIDTLMPLTLRRYHCCPFRIPLVARVVRLRSAAHTGEHALCMGARFIVVRRPACWYSYPSLMKTNTQELKSSNYN